MKAIVPLYTTCLVLLVLLNFQAGAQSSFVHPGILHTDDAFTLMQDNIKTKKQPAYGSYEQLRRSRYAKSDYRLEGPKKVIGRGHYGSSSRDDFKATYHNALMWKLTGDEAHAEKAMEILEAYAATLEKVDFKADGPLLVGLQGFLFVNGAEIMRSYRGMTPTKLKNIQSMFKKVFIPVCIEFFEKEPFSNGNWGASVLKGCLGYAIFTDDHGLYRRVAKLCLEGEDNGSLKYYIDGETGQNQEAGRDQQHSQLGVACLAEAAEVAHSQGHDLYGALNNRILKGFEYLAKHNLNERVPYKVWSDLTGKYDGWKKISEPGRLGNIYAMAYNHYVLRKGLKMPYTKQAVEKIQPEREGIYADHPGFGSLLFLGVK